MAYARAGAWQAAGSGLANFGRQLMGLSAERKAEEDAERERLLRQKQLDYALEQDKNASMDRLAERQTSENRWQAEQARARDADKFNQSRVLAEMLAGGNVGARIEDGRLVRGEYDPTAGEEYQSAKAMETLRTDEDIRRGRAFADMGYTPTGSNITPERASTPPRQDFILVGGRYFPNTPEGAGQAMEWQQQLGEARGGGMEPWEQALVESLQGGEPGGVERSGGFLGLFGKKPATAEPTNFEGYVRDTMGTRSPRKPVTERMAELKAQGKTFEEAQAILRREGYR